MFWQNVGMSNPEDFSEVFLSDEQEFRSSVEIVDGLKEAAITLSVPPEWPSADGCSFFIAKPLTFFDSDPLNPTVDISYDQLNKAGWYNTENILNTWEVNSITHADGDEDAVVRQYFVNMGGMIVREARVSVAMFGEGSQAEFFKNVFEVDHSQETPKMASIRDYANLDNALFDLKNVVTEHSARIEKLTPQELRKLRTHRRLMMVGARSGEEMTDEPQWWKIKYSGTRLYSIFARSAEDAILDLEDFFDTKTGIIEDLQIDYEVKLYGDPEQSALSQAYEGRAFVRLMPFSLVEFTSNLNDATPEQREAFLKAEKILGAGRVIG